MFAFQIYFSIRSNNFFLQSLTNLSEGQLAHLEAQVEPVGDPNLKIEWFHNGKPVGHTARMKAIHDFGFVVLELIPAEPQDSGKWVCRASNKKGQAETSCDMQVKFKVMSSHRCGQYFRHRTLPLFMNV